MGGLESGQGELATTPLLLTAEEAAEMLRVGSTTLYALMKAGELRPVHIGHSCQLSRVEIERHVRRLEAPEPAPPGSKRKRTTVDHRGLFELDSPPPDAA